MVKRIVFVVLIFAILLSGVFAIYKNTRAQKKKFVFWSIQLKPVYEKEINAVIENFEKKHPDYKTVWVDIPIGEAQKRTLASVLSDSPPDLVNLNPDFSILLAQKNALRIFDEKETQQYNPNLVEKLKFQNKIYGLPFYATSPVTVYNKEIFDICALGAVIKSYDELIPLYEKFAACPKKPQMMTVFASNLNENDTLAKILNKYDVSTLQNEAEKQTATMIFETFDNLYKNNALPKDTLTINHREVIEKYMSGGAFVAVTGSNFINMIKQNANDIYLKSELSSQLTGSNGKYDVALMNLIIPKNSKNAELALEFALELTNRENQLKLAKITNVLPANKYALEDDYFKNCSEDLVDKSRCIAARQLDNLNTTSFSENNKKAINELLNKTLEEILLNPKKSDIKEKIENLSSGLKLLN